MKPSFFFFCKVSALAAAAVDDNDDDDDDDDVDDDDNSRRRAKAERAERAQLVANTINVHQIKKKVANTTGYQTEVNDQPRKAERPY